MLLTVTMRLLHVNSVFLTFWPFFKRAFPQRFPGIHHVMQFDNISTTIKWDGKRWLSWSRFLFFWYDMAANGIDVPNMEVIVNRSAALLTRWHYYVLQRLDGHIEVTSDFPIACGGYADIYSGVWRGGRAFLAPGVWTGEAISGRNVLVGIFHIYIAPPPNSRILTGIKVAIKIFRDAHNKAHTPEAQRKYSKASVNGSLSSLLGHP